MDTKASLSLLCSGLLLLAGCQKHVSTQPTTNADQERSPTTLDVCGLITKEEIEAIQGSPIKEVKGSQRLDESFRVSQCFYGASDFSKSVVLGVTQSDPTSPNRRSVKDFWKNTFGRYDVKDKEQDEEKRESLRDQRSEKEREQEGIPPKKVNDIGDAAYWSSNRAAGVLYVLKKDKDAYIRVSIGGTDDEETKLNKLKALAQ